LAASKESVLTPEVKNAMINATWNDIVTLDDRLKQNALVFSQVVSKDVNNTFSLTTGISSKADQGHIFAGAGIDHIKEIKPMKQIIEELMNF
jgi:NAD(P)H-dependent flavin oxidoreductase YrpB (nitropropane dioxygenase family)